MTIRRVCLCGALGIAIFFTLPLVRPQTSASPLPVYLQMKGCAFAVAEADRAIDTSADASRTEGRQERAGNRAEHDGPAGRTRVHGARRQCPSSGEIDAVVPPGCREK